MVNNGIGSIDQFRKKVTNTHETISTSYHEAGHAIYGLLHYIKIDSVYIFENKKTKRIDGFTHDDSPIKLESLNDSILFEDRLNTEICFYYSGLIAERHFFKMMSGSDKFPSFLKDGSSDDTMEAAALIRKYGAVAPGRKRYDYKKNLIKETTQELQNNWEAVTVIAHSLFQKKNLSFLDLKNLLIRKTENKKFWREQFKNINYIYDNYDALDENSLKSILSL